MMKKKASFMLAMVTALAVLAGCGGNAAAPATRAAATPAVQAVPTRTNKSRSLVSL